MMKSDSILYYPSIEFHSANWVKAALLVWDHVYRIVPPSYTPNDPPEIKRAIDADLVRTIVLEPNDLLTTYNEFVRFCRSLQYLPAGLEPTQQHRVHKDKIDVRLYPLLEKIAEKFDGDWFYLPPEIAHGYLLYLSIAIAKRRQLARGTDDSDAWVVSAYMSERGNFSDYVYDKTQEWQYCNINIKELMPVNISNIPMTKIVKFASSRSSEKTAFRQAIYDVTHNISKCESESHVEMLLRDFQQNLIEKKQQLRKSMNFCNSEELTSSLIMGVPIAMTVLGMIYSFNQKVDFASFFSSIGIGTVAAYADYKRAKRTNRPDHLASYLVNLDEQMAKERSYPNFSYLMDEFIND